MSDIRGAMRSEEAQALREVVVKRRVCWEVFPERVGIRGETKTVGYELVLSGIHLPSDPDPLPTPGCASCKAVFEDLNRISNWILPKGDRESFYEIAHYAPIIRHTRKRRLRPEVTLSVRILHRQRYEDPIDPCETRCLGEMEQKLKQLWACEGEWMSLTQRGIRRGIAGSARR